MPLCCFLISVSTTLPISLVNNQRPFPPQWTSLARPLNFKVPHHWRLWLHDKGSLTQKLINASNGHFQVRVVRNEWAVPCHSEAMAVGLKPREMAIIREVELLCYGQVWVAARSIIPHSTLIGRLRRFKDIGSKPLGALLFSHPNMKRGQLEIARLSNSEQSDFSWARRSGYLGLGTQA